MVAVKRLSQRTYSSVKYVLDGFFAFWTKIRNWDVWRSIIDLQQSLRTKVMHFWIGSSLATKTTTLSSYNKSSWSGGKSGNSSSDNENSTVNWQGPLNCLFWLTRHFTHWFFARATNNQCCLLHCELLTKVRNAYHYKR